MHARLNKAITSLQEVDLVVPLDADGAAKTLDPEREKHLLGEVPHRPEAFRELYRCYFPRVYAYVAYRVGTVQDAEDLVSETFLKVIEKLDTFHYRGEGSFAAWLFRIAHNLVSDLYRRQGRRGDAVSLGALSQLQDDCSVPDKAVVQCEEFARLREMLATLSPRRQEVISLKFFGGLRNQEIAQILGLNERAVSSHLCRGLEDLHRRYTGSPTVTRNGAHHENL